MAVRGRALARGRLSAAVLAERALLAALALWGLVPIVLIAVHALGSHQRLTGADGTIGGDQLQYLAWVRDAGSHGLASNLFTPVPSAHVFAQPMFTLSGALWRLGLPIQLSYLLWKPVAIVVLFAGAAAWARRAFADRPGRAAAAIALSLFFFTPLAWIALWGTVGSAATRGDLLQIAGEMFSAGQLWGYLPSAIAIGLMPIALLATERGLRATSLREARGALAVAFLASLLLCWLHPWQGATLVVILAGLGAWSRGRGARVLALPVLGALLPLAYYLLLSKYDSAWRMAARSETVPHLPAAVLLAGLGPPVLLAVAGVSRPGAEPFERVLLLWVPASLVTYAVLNSFPAHALEGIGLPLSVLGVRGWSRITRWWRWSRWRDGQSWRRSWLTPATIVGALAVAAVTLPGMAYVARGFRNVARNPLLQEYYLPSSDSRALDWVATKAPPGGVMASPFFAIVVPSQTGRRVWVGNQFWSQDYVARERAVGALFGGRLSPQQARSLLFSSGVRLVIGDCRRPLDLAPILGPALASTHRFGCASVYVVAGRPSPTP